MLDEMMFTELNFILEKFHKSKFDIKQDITVSHLPSLT